MAGSLLHLNTSQGEGWGLCVLEAAALGVPTVAFDVDGLRDAVRDGRDRLAGPGRRVDRGRHRAGGQGTRRPGAPRAEVAAACRALGRAAELGAGAPRDGRAASALPVHYRDPAGPSARRLDRVQPVRTVAALLAEGPVLDSCWSAQAPRRACAARPRRTGAAARAPRRVGGARAIQPGDRCDRAAGPTPATARCPAAGLRRAASERGGRRAAHPRLVAFCLLLEVLPFVTAPGNIIADTKLDLAIDPAGFLARALSPVGPAAVRPVAGPGGRLPVPDGPVLRPRQAGRRCRRG